MDDASIIAPDTWSGKIGYASTQWGHENDIITFPPHKQFYCTIHRLEIALISSDMYFTTGVRYMLEDIKDMILHIYKDHNQLYKYSTKDFDLVILSASDMKDIPKIYRTILRLRLAEYKSFILAFVDNNVRHALKNIAGRYSGVKVLSSREKLSVLKQEIMMALTDREVKNKNQYFPAILTPWQTDILLMAADGLSAEDIALRTGVSTSTIYATKARMLDKAGATSKALEAILYSQVRDEILHPDSQYLSGVPYSRTRYSRVG